MRDPDACKTVIDVAVRKFGRVDILINGAAGNFLAEARNLSPKGFKTVRYVTFFRLDGCLNYSHLNFF